MLDMRFLGVPQVTLDDRPVHLERHASLALLAYLVVTRRPSSRSDLAALLAGEMSDVSARKRLRNALADLHHGGIGPYLHATRDWVAFDVSLPHFADTRRMDELVLGRASAGSDDLQWAASHCDVELLAGLELRSAPGFEAWLVHERERRLSELMRLSLHLLDRHCASGALDAGMSLAHRILAVEPWREEVHRLLMWLLVRSGQPAAAMEQYERCRRVLAEELGVEPEPETVALANSLKARDRWAPGRLDGWSPSVPASG